MFRHSKLARLLSIALLVAAPVVAQAQNADPEPGDDSVVILQPKKDGYKIPELFEAISQMTGASILFEDNNAVIRSKTVNFIGKQAIPRGRLFDWLQAVLSYHGLVLVPVGPPGPTGQQQWFALDQANANLTSRPMYIAEDDILDFQDRDGLYVVTSLTLKHITDTARVRQALSQLSTKTAGLGRINDIQGTRALIIGDFAPIVAAMKRLLDFIDVENPRIEPKMKVIQLQYAVATELEPIIQELIEQSNIATGPRPGRNPQNPDEEPEPKIMADPRLDALIVYAVDSHMQKIEELIATLDVPNSNFRQRIHFRPLRHTDADEMADIIQELITDTGVGGGSRTSSSSRNNRRAPAPQAGAPGAFGSGTEGDPVIIADRRSNSLIIHASPTQFGEIDELISKLDQSRPQVLIETALVELALTDQLTLGVELFGTSNDIAVDTDNDGVADALTNATKFFSASSFGLTDTVTTDVNGVNVPINRSPTLGTGLNAGIFSDGKLPVMLTAFASTGRAKIVTMPSVVTNDNEEATLSLTRTTSFRQTVRDQNNESRDSFDTVTATTELTISPTIASDNYLRLEINQSVENFGARPSPDAPPDQTSRTVSTNVTVPDKYTVVLGGLVQREERSTVSKVPFLGDLPILGWLFRTTDDSANPSHLFLFVTPRILRDTETFGDYHRLTWEKKLLQDDLFGKSVDMMDANFHGPYEDETADETLRRIEQSGELDAVRLKAPISEAERIDMARKAARADGTPLPPPPPEQPTQPARNDGE